MSKQPKRGGGEEDERMPLEEVVRRLVTTPPRPKRAKPAKRKGPRKKPGSARMEQERIECDVGRLAARRTKRG